MSMAVARIPPESRSSAFGASEPAMAGRQWRMSKLHRARPLRSSNNGFEAPATRGGKSRMLDHRTRSAVMVGSWALTAALGLMMSVAWAADVSVNTPRAAPLACFNAAAEADRTCDAVCASRQAACTSVATARFAVGTNSTPAVPISCASKEGEVSKSTLCRCCSVQ